MTSLLGNLLDSELGSTLGVAEDEVRGLPAALREGLGSLASRSADQSSPTGGLRNVFLTLPSHATDADRARFVATRGLDGGDAIPTCLGATPEPSMASPSGMTTPRSVLPEPSRTAPLSTPDCRASGKPPQIMMSSVDMSLSSSRIGLASSLGQQWCASVVSGKDLQ